MTKTFGNDQSVMQATSPAALSQVTVVEEPETAESAHAGASFDGFRGPRLKRTPLIGSLLFGIAALAFFIIGMTKPAMMYFDEPYFVPEATAFALGRPNPHPIVPTLAKPPLGKYIMSFGIRAAGNNPFGWRIAGAICGALTLVAVYLWTYLLLQDAGLAALAATLTLFNNFLFVMSRIAMMDAYLVVLLMWSVVAYTAAFVLEVRPIVRRLLVVCAGVLVGFAGACKWNAVDTLSVFLLVGFGLPLVRRLRFAVTDSSFRNWTANAEQIGRWAFLLGLIVAPFLSYALTFWPLCQLLHRPFSFHELVSMNAAIWHFNSTTVSNRAITLAWYLWPLNLKPTRALSYLVGNPVVTWGGLVALALCIRQAWKSIGIPEALVLLLFLSNYLQWAVTPEKGLFYYYYYPAVMILGVAIAVALRSLPSHVFGVRIGFIVGLLAIVVFVWCFPRMAHLDSPWDCALGCWV